MRVILRNRQHGNTGEGVDLGQMNPEQFHNLYHDLRTRGFYHLPDCQDYDVVDYQYVESDGEFIAEILWSDESEED